MKKIILATPWTFLVIGYILALAMIFSPIIKPAMAHLVNACLEIGSNCTLATKVYVLTPNLTPANTPAAIGTTAQTFSVTGIANTAKIYVQPPTPTSLCPMVSARVNGTDSIALHFSTLTAVACTPATGIYHILVIQG